MFSCARNLLTIGESDNKLLFKKLLNFENTVPIIRMIKVLGVSHWMAFTTDNRPAFTSFGSLCFGLWNLLTISEGDNKRLFKNLLNFENTVLLTKMYRLSYCLV